MATLVIGDVHGQLIPLQKMLRHSRDACVILLGDLVGRGPDSLAVLHEVAACGAKVEVILGNHDLHLLWCHTTGQAAGPELDQFLAAADCDQLCTWLRQQSLALEIPDAGVLAVHAGVWHGWNATTVLELAAEVEAQLRGPEFAAALVGLYGNDELQWDDDLVDARRWQAIVNLLTRMRVCHPDGRMVAEFAGRPDEVSPPDTVAWFDLPDRQLAEQLIVCGHWSGHGLLLRNDVVMLDSGCCFGGPLTGLWLEERRLVFAN